jgi:hypothetical protein
MWPTVLLQHLNPTLPPDYCGGPRVQRRETDDPPVEEEFALRVYEVDGDERLVAAIEIVSPRNVDTPESRQEFVSRCSGYLRHGVCVSLVDIVTQYDFNLCADRLDSLGCADPSMGEPSHPLYAVTMRPRAQPSSRRLETWAYRLQVGQPLPTLPL